MSDNSARAVDLLQELGLKEYEAKCLMALTRLSRGTAKEVSEVADVPRTRVYDAIRVLQSQGLVEVTHSNPQQFRAVPVDEVVGNFRTRYGDRIDDLQRALCELTPIDDETGDDTQEVWVLSGSEAIAERTRQLVRDADEELVLVVGVEDLLDSELLDVLADVVERGVDVSVGVLNEDVADAVEERIPNATVFVSGLTWLQADDGASSVAIGRLLLVDGDTILVSSYNRRSDDHEESAMFGQGFANGLVVIVRRLLATRTDRDE